MDTISETSLNVLVVDDVETICIGLKDVLEHHGHVVDYITKGEDLSMALDSTRFDAVIMDLRLPGYSGIDLASYVKNMDPSIACIISTAYGNIPDVVEALNQGFEGFVEKPYTFETMITVLERGVRLAKTRALVESENRYRNLIESSMEAVNVVQDGVVVFANQESSNLLGYNSVEEIIGKDSRTFLHPDYHERVIESNILRQRGEDVPSRYRAVMLSKGGASIPVEFNASYIDWDGKPGSLVFIRDIGARLRYEKKLRTMYEHSAALDQAESEEEVYGITYTKIQEALKGSLHDVMKLENGVLTDIYSHDALFSMPIDGLGISARAARTQEPQMVNDVSNDPDYLKGDHRKQSGSEIAVPVVLEGETVAVLNVENEAVNAYLPQDQQVLEAFAISFSNALSRLQEVDRLEAVVAERTLDLEESNSQLRDLDRMKTQFISTATHELRTPVTSILGFLEIVLDDPSRDISETIRKDLNVVFRNANRLVTLTNDLLDVQRITSGRFEVNLDKVDIMGTLNEVVEELTPLFDDKQQVLLVEAPSELIVDVDEIRISQLFINLLRNANKFTPEKGNITATVEPFETHVQISVKDSGIGLSEEDIGKLFTPFPGIHHGLNVSSTGLGLSIAKGIVELHGGEIWVESEGHGKGSIFIVKLPL